jgi:LytS/YehU family sensor histidine kinase
LIIIIIYSYSKRRIDKNKWLKEKSQLERMAFRLQMNPHFTFNALESISAYILDSEPKQAIVYLQKFSSLMRYTLESADQQYVFLDKEIGALENYIALEQMRFGSGFQSVIQLDPEIDRDSLAIPPMLIQPLVENSILHGLRPLIQQKRDNGLLKIYFMIHPQEENSLLIQIEDNGIGRKASRSNNTGDEGEKRGAATKILSKRLQAMSLESGFPHKVFVHDLNAGTRVSLVLPMIRNWEFSD